MAFSCLSLPYPLIVVKAFAMLFCPSLDILVLRHSDEDLAGSVGGSKGLSESCRWVYKAGIKKCCSRELLQNLRASLVPTPIGDEWPESRAWMPSTN